MMSCEVEVNKLHTNEEVGFLPNEKPKQEVEVDNLYPLLTREDLVALDLKSPFWRRLRIALFILFWITFAGLILAAILIIVFTPKCPPRPQLTFWQSKVGYWVDPFAFRDSNDDKVGDLRGLIDGIDYIKNKLGAEFVVLGSVISGYFSSRYMRLGVVDDFMAVDPAAGSIDDFRNVIKTYHKSGLEVVMTLDFNSVSESHEWTKDGTMLVPYNQQVSRSGDDARVVISGTPFYSVFDAPFVDINLDSPTVREKVSDVTNFWLREGVDGILLSNTAFYVENNEMNSQASLGNISRWYEQYPSSQIFTNKTLDFVQYVRKLVDKSTTTSGKPKLLAVEAGNVGYGLRNTHDEMLKYLGSAENPGAHVIVSREFVHHRGWKITPPSGWDQSKISTYDASSGQKKSSMALTTATPNDLRSPSIISLASSLLLPGIPLIYYGSELGTNFSVQSSFMGDFYPKSLQPQVTSSVEASVLSSHLAMPWSLSGAGFSSAVENSTQFSEYLRTFGITETVESALAAGRGDSPFSLVKRLVQLRQKPSLKWGEFMSFTQNNFTESVGFQVFVRKAIGFPAFIIAVRDSLPQAAVTFDFSSVCDTVTPRAIFPSRRELALDEPVNSNRIYLTSNEQSSVYVFECS